MSGSPADHPHHPRRRLRRAGRGGRTMIRRRAVLAGGPVAAVVGLVGAVTEWRRRRPAEGPSEASGAPTYLFAQQHRDALPWWEGRWRPQRVVSGARLRVQLPGDPIRWVPRIGAGCQPTPWPGGRRVPAAEIELQDQAVIANPGRIEGAEVLYQFDYRVTGRGVAVVCLDPDPVPDDPEALSFPPGSHLDYVLTVLVR